MADGYEYVVEMVDRLTGPAKTMRQQIDSLTEGLAKDAAEVKELEELYKVLRSEGALTAKTEKEMTDAITKGNSSMQKQATEIRKLVAAEKEQAAAGGESAESLEVFSAEALAAAAAVAAVAIAIGALVIGGAKIALEAAHFKSNTTDALKSALGSEEAAKDTFIQIRRISDEIGISEKRAQSLGLSLIDAGVAQKDLGDAIKAIAILEKVRGTEVANKLQKVIEQTAASGKFELNAKKLAGTGISEADVIGALAKQMKLSQAEVQAQMKAGKITATEGVKAIQDAITTNFGKDAGGFETVQDGLSKIYEMFTRLFEDVDASGILDSLKEVASWLDTSTVAGSALHFIFTTAFQGLFDLLKALLPYAKEGFLELVIVALKIYIAFKPLEKQLEKLAKDMGITGDAGDTLGTVITFLIDVFGVWLRFVISRVEVLIEIIQTIVDIFNVIGDAASFAFDSISAGAAAVWDFLSGLFDPAKSTEVATSLIQGLIDGIIGGGPLVSDAMKTLGNKALDSVKDVLGIHSPSQAMAELGNYTVAGFTGAVNDNADAAQASLANVVAPPAASAPASGAASGGGGVTVVFEPGSVVVQAGGGNAQEIAEAVESKLADMLENLAMQYGGAGPAEEKAA